MGKIKLARNIKKEIEKLNHDIDLKIIKGLPYRAEARRHKFLTSQFYIFNPRNQKGFFKRTMGALATIML